MRFKYEDLEIWRLSMDLIVVIYKIVENFPVEERFALSSQGRRAVTSISLNIAEGAGRHSYKDFANFLNRAITSLQEVDTILKIAFRLNYIDLNNCNLKIANELIEKIYFKTIAFRKSIVNNY
ncbi:MAG: four helix bundle protein [Patescibacteria group bacterium]